MAEGTGQRLHIITSGQNFTDLAEIYYNDWTKYQRIVSANPNYAKRPPHFDDRNGTTLPTLYVGDKVMVPIDPKPKEEPPAEQPQPQAGKMIRKSERTWFSVKHQHPNPRLEIYTNSNPQQADLIYEGEAKYGIQTKLLSYEFTEAVDDLEGAFSFTVENEETGNDAKTTFDSIPLRSIVKIYEADDRFPVFVGIIKRRRIKSSMTAQGPKRTITFSGKSIISVIAEYTISLDFKIMNVEDAGKASRRYTLKLEKEKEISIMSFMISTWEFFLELAFGKDAAGGVGSSVMDKIANEFIINSSGDNKTDADSEKNTFANCFGKGAERTIQYPIANAPFNQSNNVIANLWRNILPEPIYEIFAYCDRETGAPKIMAREAPFGCKDTKNKDWLGLDIYEIDPIALIDYDLNQSDEEVYTVFSAWLIGSSMDRKFNIAKEQAKQDDVFVKDEAKLAIYGYKPLEVNFQGYDTQYTKTDNQKEKFSELNRKSKYQYGRLDDMYAGSITLITDFIKPKNNERDRNPRIGCRARFLGGEFYITKAAHRWQYGQTPTITLSISRGMKYDGDGYQRDGADGVLSDIGKRYKELG